MFLNKIVSFCLSYDNIRQKYKSFIVIGLDTLSHFQIFQSPNLNIQFIQDVCLIKQGMTARKLNTPCEIANYFFYRYLRTQYRNTNYLLEMFVIHQFC